MLKRTVPGFVAGAIFTVAIAGGGAVAATGGKFILGQSNKAGSTTTLTATRGSALSLKSTGAPALKVNNSRKVTNLNADSIDGLSSGSFARSNARTGAYDATGTLVDSDNDGLDDLLVASVQCPAGSQMTGGGGIDFTNAGIMFYNAPDIDEAWITAVLLDENTPESADSVYASVVCYNATGSLAGSYRKVPTNLAAIPTDVMARITKKATALQR